MEPTWDILLESTFNRVNDILGETEAVEDMITEEDMIEQAVTSDLLSDSRLDANSILIEDIQLDDDTEESGHRDRSNTWPCPAYRPSCSSPAGSQSSGGSPAPSLGLVSELDEEERAAASPSTIESSARSKLATRKNPWGNLSYAELIVQVCTVFHCECIEY